MSVVPRPNLEKNTSFSELTFYLPLPNETRSIK